MCPIFDSLQFFLFTKHYHTNCKVDKAYTPSKRSCRPCFSFFACLSLHSTNSTKSILSSPSQSQSVIHSCNTSSDVFPPNALLTIPKSIRVQTLTQDQLTLTRWQKKQNWLVGGMKYLILSFQQIWLI